MNDMIFTTEVQPYRFLVINLRAAETLHMDLAQVDEADCRFKCWQQKVVLEKPLVIHILIQGTNRRSISSINYYSISGDAIINLVTIL